MTNRPDPRSKGTGPSRQLPVRLKPDEYAALTQASQNAGSNKSEIVRGLIAGWLKKRRRAGQDAAVEPAPNAPTEEGPTT